MFKKNPFERINDDGYDVLMAEKYYVLTNINKKWGMDNKFDAVIEKVIFRGEKPWTRMDIEVRTSERTIHTHIGEFIEHYHPENVPKFDANKLFKKVEKHYGYEYEIEVK